MKNTIKSFYKAVTTTKRYIVTEDCSTNFPCLRYLATNNLKEKYLEYPFSVIDCENLGENLGCLQDKANELNASWSVVCYQFEWADFLKQYDLTEWQYQHILKLLKD